MEEVRNVWLEQGRDILFVTSNSPVWAKHIDQEILPLIKNRAIVINWSERTKWEWDKSLEARVFKQWLGAGKYIFDGKIFWQGREFCPAAIIFKSHGKPTVIRFWQAYKDLKHGNFELFNQQISKLNKLLK